jgi:hypothetical protein
VDEEHVQGLVDRRSVLFKQKERLMVNMRERIARLDKKIDALDAEIAEACGV